MNTLFLRALSRNTVFARARFTRTGLALLAMTFTLALAAGNARACGVCAATLNSDWASQGYTVGPGIRIDLRYDDYTQDQQHSGTSKADPADLVIPNADEIQRTTRNRVTTLGIDYSPSYAWGLDIQLPWVDRFHDTYDAGESDLSSSHSQSIGDLRVTARYQGFAANSRSGVQFGLKLPTGATDEMFLEGPVAGEPLDRGLQPGTGSTDLLLGAFRYGNRGEKTGWFVQAQGQAPLTAHDAFRPGASLTTTFGVRLLSAQRAVPQLQVNARIEGRESGANADRDNSGAQRIFISPGFNLHVNHRLGGYVFVQFPLYQHVNGLQLEPERLLSAGLHYRL